MTDAEADELDELLTKTTPKVRSGEGGVFTRERNLLNALDPRLRRIISAPRRKLSVSPPPGAHYTAAAAGKLESAADSQSDSKSVPNKRICRNVRNIKFIHNVDFKFVWKPYPVQGFSPKEDFACKRIVNAAS